MLSDDGAKALGADPKDGLNAPYGARCFLTLFRPLPYRLRAVPRLNAPYGARCFLTTKDVLAGNAGTDLS